MTIRDIMESVKQKRNLTLSDAHCVRCLSELDSKIYEDIILRHAGKEQYMLRAADGSVSDRPFPYKSDASRLIAPERFFGMYEAYLMCEADYALDEIGRYRNDLLLFERAYNGFAAWYNETHLPAHGARITAVREW